jgi:predicted ferric reductase
MKITLLYAFALANLAAVVFFWSQGSGGLLVAGRADFALVFIIIGRLAGLLAVLGILTQVIVISRAKWLEPVFGFDKLTVFHHWLGVSAGILILSHPVLLGLGYGAVYGNSYFGQVRDFLFEWEYLFPAAVAAGLFGLVIVLSILTARKRLKYETWYYIHLSVYAAILLAFAHQAAVGGTLGGSAAFRSYWFSLYAFAFGNLIIYRFGSPAFNYWRQRFYVERIVPEGADAASVYIKGRNLPRFPVKAGQFMILRFLAKGYWVEAHPFSLSVAPNPDFLRVTIKNVGDFTARVRDIPVGTRVLIDGPHGAFVEKDQNASKYLLAAGGIGITPLRSLAEYLLAQGKDVILLYSARTAGKLVYKDELEELAKNYPERFRLEYYLTQEGGRRLDQATIGLAVPDTGERTAYVCGPPGFIKAVKRCLLELGINNKNIHYEKFSF